MTENCFNGVDDDCDGLVDCADTTDCPSSVAVCVPAQSGAAYGTVLAGSPEPACPQATAAQLVYGDFNNANNTCVGCTSSASGTARVEVFSDSGTMCTASQQHTPAGTFTGSQCTSITTFETASFVLAGVSCSAPTGTPQKAPAGITEKEFCASPSVGGGCPAGNVCAPAVGSNNTCILVDAATNCSSTSYPQLVAPTSGTWYPGFADNRQCPASCTGATTFSSVLIYGYQGTDTSCSGSFFNLQAKSNSFLEACGAGTHRYNATVTSCTVADLPATNTIVPVGSQKGICCLH
jgi:hypothetical protein